MGHPSHPMVVHFPTALFPTSLLFDLLSLGNHPACSGNRSFFKYRRGSTGLNLAIITGLVDYFGMVPGSRKHRVTTWHLLLNLPMVAIFAFSLVLRWLEMDAARTPLYIIGLSLVGLILLIVGNYFGSELVYRMGMRVNTGRLRETPLLLRVVAAVRRSFGAKEPG